MRPASTPPSRYRVHWRDDTGTLRSLSLPTRRLAVAAQSYLAHSAGPLTLNRLVDLWAAAPVAPTRRSTCSPPRSAAS